MSTFTDPALVEDKGMDLQLGGKTAIVTGGASGMGKATAKLMAAEGAKVWIGDFNVDGAKTTATEIESAGGKAEALPLDVSSREQWKGFVDKVFGADGKIDIICNVAGPGARSGHLDTDDAEWSRQIEGHLNGVFLGCQTVLPLMMERKYGKIINMCSFTAHGVGTNIPGYCAAFGGILAYTKTLARFAAPHNINVNCVSPGNIETPMTRDGWLDKPGALDALREKTPIGRVGQPDDVAYWLVVLASDRARHLVGVEINVSGGQLLA
jgi:NAD(P)-dependent dehydrogenase (short-subunit alcohol dehydrogenase family)